MKKLFKVLLIVVLFISVFVITGCGKKEESAPTHPIVGSWKYAGGYDYTYTFKADGTLTYVGYGSVMEGTYKVDGDKISILYKGNQVPFESTYTIDGETLNIKDSLGSDTIYNKQ